MATRFEVTYTDGKIETVDRRAVHFLRVERLVVATDRKIGMQEEALMYVWAAATGGTGSVDDFDAWVESVDDWKRAEVESDPPVQGSDSSPT